MPVDANKWSELVSVTLVYIQETLDELIHLQMNEGTIKEYFTRMYFDISRENETDETKELLEKITMFRENNRNVFVSTLDFLIAPLHQQIELLNTLIDKPSEEAKEKLLEALNIHARSCLFIKKLYQDEYEIVSEYLDFKNKYLQSFTEEKLKLEKNLRKTDDTKIDSLCDEVLKINF